MSDPTIETLRREGYAVVPDLLSPSEVTELRQALAPIVGPHARGRNAFEGQRTQRVYALLTKCPAVARLAEHPRVLEIGEAFLDPAFLLSSLQAINILPGESAQALHCDDDAGAPERPRPPQGFSTVWALDDFSAENGSTCVVPRSHLFDEAQRSVPADPVSVTMRAGSVLVYLGGVLHGGGEHRAEAPRLGVSIIYCQPWLRQFENLTVATPPEVARGYSERIQRMLGFSMYGPMGNIDGRTPQSYLQRREANA